MPSPHQEKSIRKMKILNRWDWIEPPHIYSEVADLFVHDMACGFRTKTIIAETL